MLLQCSLSSPSGASPRGVALPHFWWSSRPAGCSNVLECRAFVDFSRRPDRELAAGGRAAQNCVCLQRDHSSRTNSLPPKVRLSRTFGGAQGQRGAATSWSAAPLSIFRAAPIANWQQEAGLPKTAFASNGITALGLIPFHQKCGRASLVGSDLSLIVIVSLVVERK